jgi:hypothetical protein
MRVRESSLVRFYIFCLEAYKSHFGLSGKEAYDLFEKTGVFGYLKDGYDVLHTQGSGYIVEDIHDYILHHSLETA